MNYIEIQRIKNGRETGKIDEASKRRRDAKQGSEMAGR